MSREREGRRLLLNMYVENHITGHMEEELPCSAADQT